MIKFKRHIKVDDQVFETWFGMDIKKKGSRPNVSIFYYTDDPNEELSVHQLIKANFTSKDEAVKYGTRFMRRMYQDMIKREASSSEENQENEEETIL
ncbi:hypothetical protein [Marinifilum caeruleilacunae]|uniref:Uncharacterized protein n=1 Tax=Marinifilum caeruleilacunae TaxID=2499076 RepID=A0ABX1WVA0_9BACT|nr:hypothetical protein [Marinifilum caeruleilacunae]NOU60040.1 hypothetical protein [Marinifilum caeruleilacunae]